MRKAGSNGRGRGGRSASSRSDRDEASRFEFTIPSDFKANESRAVHKEILAEIARRGYNSQAAFAIKLALEEALINAIKHGNQFDTKKKVFIEAKITAAQAEIIVEDEGGGFQRSSVPDPTLHENLQKCSGRGILLIEAYMNEVEWSKNGRRLRMIKRNEPDVFPRG